jgi:anti-sigma B factor antagonist
MSDAPELSPMHVGRAIVVRLTGEIDRLNAAAIQGAIERAVHPAAVGLVCDLADVDYLDSSGVHLLHAVARALGRRGQRLALVRPRRRTPADVLRLTGIGEIAPLYDGRDAALAAFGGA